MRDFFLIKMKNQLLEILLVDNINLVFELIFIPGLLVAWTLALKVEAFQVRNKIVSEGIKEAYI